ncbi:PRC and DUF2382 domain-containing protein [soil metagenome]
MTMQTPDELQGWIGQRLIGSDGDKIGEVVDIYADDDTGQPEWLAVKTGLFGSNVSFVPLAQVAPQADELAVPYTKDQVKEAPNVDPDGHITPDEEARLYQHYGFSYAEQPTAGFSETGESAGEAAMTDDAMTRSEQELRVGTTTEEAGRVRLRKWVETERVSETVPVAHEEVRIEREPITEPNMGDALQGPDLSEDEHEVILHEERVVAETETVPKERVRVETDVVTGEEQVEADLQKERIDVERS